MSPSNHRFVDTNILLRFLTNDLPEQADKASMLMQRIQSGRETVELSILAAAEIVWTLERFYKLSKSNVASKMSSILKLKSLRISNKNIFLEALSLYAEKNISFTDAYIAIQMKRAGSSELYTFDKEFDRVEHVQIQTTSSATFS